MNGSVALGLAIAPFLFLVSATAEGVTLYECELKAGVTAKGGELRPVTDKWMRLHSPMTVDLASGIIRFGVDRSVERWKIVQNGDDSNDWQLIREEPLFQHPSARALSCPYRTMMVWCASATGKRQSGTRRVRPSSTTTLVLSMRARANRSIDER